MRLWPFGKRRTYRFTHPKADNPIDIRAWSERSAWRKLRAELFRQLYGDWVFVYNPAPLERVLADVTVSIVEGESNAPTD